MNDKPTYATTETCNQRASIVHASMVAEHVLRHGTGCGGTGITKELRTTTRSFTQSLTEGQLQDIMRNTDIFLDECYHVRHYAWMLTYTVRCDDRPKRYLRKRHS